MPNPYTGTENDPFQEAQHRYLGPQWEQFFGSLKGKNVRFINPTPVAGGTGELRPGDLDTQRSNATNAYLNQLTDQNRSNANDLRAQTAGADIAEAQARGVAQQEQDQRAVDTAMQTGGQPAAPIGQNPDGSYTTMRQAGPPPTVEEQRATVLKMLPGHLQPVYQAQFAAQDLKAAQAEKARAEAEKALAPPPDKVMSGMDALYKSVDPKALAEQIRSGDMSPILTDLGRPAAAAVQSELTKPGPNGEKFNLADAQRIWASQKRLNSTMNGGQQVRLDTSIRSGLQMFDVVDELSSKWEGMGLGPLSRANLKLAMEGAKGPEAAKVANELNGQIGQLTSDIATIEQGGMTPTNEARAVAEKSLQAWWGDKTIKAMTAQGRMNMKIRERARNETQPLTIGNTGPSAPVQAPKGGGIVVKAPDGSDHPFDTQAQADAFKKLAGIK